MNISTIKLAASRGLLVGKKYLPEILLGVGLVSGGVATVMACGATLKAQYIMEDAKTNLKAITDATEQHPEKYSSEDRRLDLVNVYSKTGIELVKTYGPAFTLGVASLICILSSRNIMNKRNVALVAAYGALEKGFKTYRGRVVDELGADMDHHFRYGTEKMKIEEAVTDPETGKTKKVKSVVEVYDPAKSIYSRFFDDTCQLWQGDPHYNKTFLLNQQVFANDRLHAQGHLFLNDVYHALGYPDTPEGAVVGWVLSTEPGHDNHVDFGIFDAKRASNRQFVNGFESCILLDFNVDGVMFDKI